MLKQLTMWRDGWRLTWPRTRPTVVVAALAQGGSDERDDVGRRILRPLAAVNLNH
jgi:hypothetical protein